MLSQLGERIMDKKISIGESNIARVRPQAAPSLDMILDGLTGNATGGLSPTALALAYFDWALHLSKSGDKQMELSRDALAAYWRYIDYCLRASADPECASCIEPDGWDERFSDDRWRAQPFRSYAQAFLLTQDWWRRATSGVPGLMRHHADVVHFVTRQMLDMMSPANFPFSNPLIVEETIKQRGQNLLRGLAHLRDDMKRAVNGDPPAGAEEFVVGRDVATAPGQVVFRNELIELIQYEAQTAATHPEPILITPAWIMKYYILDLSPKNSLVNYLVKNGFTVFMISWKNPSTEERDLSLEDYRRLGVAAARKAVAAITQGRKIHLVGYCLGGTLAAIEAAVLARDGEESLQSLTMLAAQTDFTEAGELTLFVDESQVTFLENVMAEKGYLDSKQMAGAFRLLRSSDLIWSAMVKNYWLGNRPPMFDLMAWNADATRMPYKMHAEYLRKLFLNNDFAQDRYCVDGRPVSLRDVRAPIFAVATETDHVAPWWSVYKINAGANADVTFVLSSGGHNAGVVNPPGDSKRRHQIARHEDLAVYVDPDAWRRTAAHHEGSWWPCWLAWMTERSSAPESPPLMPRSLGSAPGLYVRER